MSHLWLDILLRLGVAVVAGGAIGWDRQRSGRPAGMRTHMLVSLGAGMAVLLPDGDTAATSRVAQGVVTGIGFVCAGEILHRRVRGGRERVKGLTSAASLWVTAVAGMVAAYGRWPLVAIGTVFTLLILTVVKRIEPKKPPRSDPPARAPAAKHNPD
jgi:putative Mg2+ transporter-C (MgtC) family protein